MAPGGCPHGEPAALCLPTVTLPAPPHPRSNRVAAWLATRSGSVIAFVALLMLGGVLAVAPPFRAVDLAQLDVKFSLLARWAPIPVSDGIAIIGIDDATLASIPEPLAVLHRPLGRAFAALAAARPRAVGLDVILPDRSFDAFAPGADQALITGLLTLRREVPIVVGVTSFGDGSLRPIHPPLLAAAGSAGDDLALFFADADGRVRRFDDRLGAKGESVSTLVGRLAAMTGVTPRNGLIQYALGSGFDYVPLSEVLAWAASGDRERLTARFGGRIVLIGSVLPHEDRKLQPVPLARWEQTRDTPGVVIHAQMLRTQLANAIVVPAPWWAQLALLALAASLWFIPAWRWRAVAFVACGVVTASISLALLRQGIDLPLGGAGRLALVAIGARTALEAWRVRRDRARLKSLFAGYVSPGVLAAILDGRLEEDARRGRRELCFLFADIRNFTRLSSKTSPEDVLALLNRYYDAVTPALHAHGGTIDNFRGDGLMAIFGAPNALANPASAGILAAHEMFERLAALNREFATEGVAPLAIGVTLACGDAVVGNVGARDRFTYSAIGEAANIAARLQDVAKAHAFPLVATAGVLTRAGIAHDPEWTPLGVVPMRGCAPTAAFGSHGKRVT
jgi:adenylate cyclase